MGRFSTQGGTMDSVRSSVFFTSYIFLGFTQTSFAGNKYLSAKVTVNVLDTTPILGVGWTQITNLKLESVCPANIFGGANYVFFDHCHRIVEAWSSAVFDTKRNRLIVYGSGHNDYYGNEIDAVNLISNSIQRLNDPGLPLAPMDGGYGSKRSSS